MHKDDDLPPAATPRDETAGDDRAVRDLVQRYRRAWDLLGAHDARRLGERPAHPVAPAARLTLADARAATAALRDELAARHQASALFGQERGGALDGILGALEQTFDGEALYPSAQARAAHLLYFVLKGHPFGDGNERIGMLLFLDYLRRHGLLLRRNGEPRFSDDAVVALALLIAESSLAQKDPMIRLVVSLLDDDR